MGFHSILVFIQFNGIWDFIQYWFSFNLIEYVISFIIVFIQINGIWDFIQYGFSFNMVFNLI